MSAAYSGPAVAGPTSPEQGASPMSTVLLAPWRATRAVLAFLAGVVGRITSRKPDQPASGPAPGSLRALRKVALVAIGVLVTAASLTSFAESYRGLFLWATEHGLHGVWAAGFPLQCDVFIAVGELALFVALADAWPVRSRFASWTVTVLGLGVSVAGNVGHIASHQLANRATAAVPPLAAAFALAVGLGVLKRVVHRIPATAEHAAAQPAHFAPTDAQHAAKLALAASMAAGNPLSRRQLITRFGISRTDERKVRTSLLAESNGSHGTAEAEAS